VIYRMSASDVRWWRDSGPERLAEEAKFDPHFLLSLEWGETGIAPLPDPDFCEAIVQLVKETWPDGESVAVPERAEELVFWTRDYTRQARYDGCDGDTTLRFLRRLRHVADHRQPVLVMADELGRIWESRFCPICVVRDRVWNQSCAAHRQCRGSCSGWYDISATHRGDNACHQCLDCCPCEPCTQCGFRVDTRCRDESACAACCDCPRCGDCGRTNATLCEDHDLCGHCCDCERDLIKLRSHELKFFYRQDKLGREEQGRYIGAEIELAGVRLKPGPNFERIMKRWSVNVVRDGSIDRADGCDGGDVEIVTQPAKGTAWTEMIRELCGELQHIEAQVNRSTGLHIHVDARDLTAFDIKNLVRVYAHVEDVLFSAIAPHRRASDHYCKPCGQEYLERFSQLNGKMLKSVLPLKQYGIRPVQERVFSSKQAKREVQEEVARIYKRRSEHKYDDTRYRALNLHSYWHRGTIEFRHHHGTADAEKIRNWGVVCMSVVHYVATHQTESDIQHLLSLQKGEALLTMVRDYGARQWLVKRIKFFTPRRGAKRRVVTPQPNGEI